MITLRHIENTVKKGGVFFISDLAELDNYEAVRKALQRLTTDGKIQRIAKGIYILPKKHDQLGILHPHAIDVATAIANRDKARIIPTGTTALHSLGLSTQIPLKAVFLTDGSARQVRIGNQTIQFKKTNPKNLSIDHKLTNLIIQALKTIGEKNVTPEQMDKIQSIIIVSGEQDLVYKHLKSAPLWIQKIVLAQ